MTPSDQEALASAQFIKASQSKGRLSAILTLVIGIAISLLFPPAAIVAVIGLIAVYRTKCSECEPHEQLLRQFAETRNWHYQAQTELRSVAWQKNRVRFYCATSVLSINDIADRLVSNDFAPRTPQPTGEVPRKQSATRQRPFSTSSPSWENVLEASIPVTDQPHIPPAGWNPAPIIPFLHDDLHTGTESPPVGLNPPSDSSSTPYSNPIVEKNRHKPVPPEQQPPAAPTDKPPRRRSARTSNPATSQSIPDLFPAPEGGRKPKTNYAVVRSAKLRKAAIQIHGKNCSACGFNFDVTFGEILSQGYIEIHHLNSISAGVRNTDPATDLAPLCGNCHAMADRLTRHHASPPRSIGELRKLLFPASILPNVETLPTTKASKAPVKIKSGKIREKKPKKDP